MVFDIQEKKMSNNEEILILLAIENANILNLLEKKKKLKKNDEKFGCVIISIEKML